MQRLAIVSSGLAALAAAAQCDITSHGAKESASDNAAAIQEAVKSCLAGGEVVIPKGEFRTGPLLVEGGNGLTVTMETGAKLRGVTRQEWPSSSSGYSTFLEFKNCDGCTLRGKGILDGGSGTKWYEDFDAGKISKHRPDFLVITGGKNMKIVDVTLLDSPMFNLKLKGVAGAEVGRINITSTWYNDDKTEPHNTDGIDPGSDSHDIWIHDVYVYNGDDGVAIKPGTESGGCTRNILVENSEFHRSHGLSIGSVGKGCVKDVIFRNIRMSGSKSQNGCRIKTYSDQPGFVRNITWENIDIKDTSSCITVNAEYKPTPSGATDFIKVSDITFKGISSSSCSHTDAEFLCPKQEPCQNIRLEHVKVSGSDGMHCSHAYGSTSDSISSCLTPSPSPSPSPSPTPSPSPSPTPSPSGCDVDACLSRCEGKYGGKVDDGKSGDAYFCAKGCAGMSGGRVADHDHFCKYSSEDRAQKCEDSCQGASSDAEKVKKCEYGCQFWSVKARVLV